MADSTDKLMEKFRGYAGQRPDPTDIDTPYFTREISESLQRQYLMQAEVHRQLVWVNRWLYVIVLMSGLAIATAATKGWIEFKLPFAS